MAFRAKHNQAAMQRRVEQGRTIKSDVGNEVYAALKRSFASKKAAATRRANKVAATDDANVKKTLGIKAAQSA